MKLILALALSITSLSTLAQNYMCQNQLLTAQRSFDRGNNDNQQGRFYYNQAMYETRRPAPSRRIICSNFRTSLRYNDSSRFSYQNAAREFGNAAHYCIGQNRAHAHRSQSISYSNINVANQNSRLINNNIRLYCGRHGFDDKIENIILKPLVQAYKL